MAIARHVERDLRRRGNHRQFDQRGNDKSHANQRVDQIVESELLGGDRELRVDGLQQHEVEPPGPDEFGQVGEIGVEERLKDLGDQLMRSDQQDNLPFCPVSDPVNITKDDLDEDDLPDEPKQSRLPSTAGNSL